MKRRYFVFGIVVSALVSLALIAGCGNPTGGGGGGGGGGSHSGPTFYNNSIWVSNSGSDDAGTGTDEANAFQTIGHALSVATAETLIRVMDGVYNEHLTWPATNTVCLSGESMDGTIISGEGANICIKIDSTTPSNQTITMESLTITGGYNASDSGGGISIQQSNIVLYLRRVAMTYNSVDTTGGEDGGAIYGDDTTDSIAAVNCLFSSNEAYEGGAIYLNVGGASDTNFLSAKNCSFFSNSAKYSGGAIFAPYVSLEASDFHDNSSALSSPNYSDSGAAYIKDGGLIVNCVFYDNKVTGSGATQTNGGAISFDNNAILNVVNCTIVSNEVIGSTAGYGGGIGVPSAAIPLLKVKNCIIWGNLAAVLPDVASYSTYPMVATCEVKYSDIGEGYVGTGNVTADPMFVGETSLPYSSAEAFKLTASSPSKVKTGGAFIGAPTTDYLGYDRSRPYSMGAFEY